MQCLGSLGYAEAIGLIGMLTGLLSVVFTAYGKHRDTNIREVELSLKKEHFIADKRHQISQEKRQELFQNKIDAYLELYEELNNLNKGLHSIGQLATIRWNGCCEYKEISKSGVHTKALISIFSIIDKNHFVISESVINQYNEVYTLYKKHNKEIDFLDSVGAMDPPEIQAAYDGNMKEFFIRYQTSIQNFFNIIDLEIKKLKIDLDI